MAMDQQQQQRMQMHPAMYGRMPHSGMMGPSQQQGHPGMPSSMGPSGPVPGGPGGPQMMGGGYHMSQHPQHPSMMNNSQNNSYPGAGPPGGPCRGLRANGLWGGTCREQKQLEEILPKEGT